MINIITSPYVIKDIEKLKKAGATSIIVGSPFFSVRSVTHFSKDEIREASSNAKNCNMQFYVLVNRFFMEDELESLRAYLHFLKELEVDGIYFSDLAVLYEAKQAGLVHKLIYNPETILTNSFDIQTYLDLGIKMCTISKEITLEDMVHIGNRIHGNLEVIVHGKLNMLHSKRQLLSNYMEFIDSNEPVVNREDLYITEENREAKMPIMEDEHGTHIFTGFTLASFEYMKQLVDANILNFRIESLFSNIDDVCQVVKDYVEVIKHPELGTSLYLKYMHTDECISTGFMFKKTGATK